MKMKLAAGAEIDMLTPDEFREGCKGIEDAIHERLPLSTIIDVPVIVNADAGGLVGGGDITAIGPGFVLYRCPTGKLARIHRVFVAAAGFDGETPLTIGHLGFYRDNVAPSSQVYFLPDTSTGTTAPALFTDDGDTAVMLRDGETLVIAGETFAPAQQFGIGLQVRLVDENVSTREGE